MRKSLLMSAAALGLVIGAPAFAQNTGGTGYNAGYAATGTAGPYSTRASNINSSDIRSRIAPVLPTPPGAHSASPEQLLGMAQSALRRGQTGEAQQALEMAMTRLLNRVTSPSAANRPDRNPMVRQINEALQALGRHDNAGAEQAIQEAMSGNRGMTTGMSQPGMPSSGAYGTSGYGNTSAYGTNTGMPNTGSPMAPNNPQMPAQTPANGTTGSAPGAAMPR